MSNFIGHFDQREQLLELLEASAHVTPARVTLDEYKSWPHAKKLAFNQERSRRIADSIVILTPALKQLRLAYRRAARVAHRPVGRTGIILDGEPTTGKTTAAVWLMGEAHRRHVNLHPHWKEDGHVSVVYLEIPPNCTGKMLMGRILNFFGEPVVPRQTLEERTRLVTELFAKSHTSLVVFDEIQNLAQSNATGRFESAQAIKNLMNAVKAVPMYVGFNLGNSQFTNDELGAQFASRCAPVHLGKLNITTIPGRELWSGVIVAFEEQLALLAHPPQSLLEHAAYLWTRTRGSIAALSRLLTTAALDLIENEDPDSEIITKKLLDTIPLDLTSERLLSEAKAAAEEAPHAA
ncbi:TniB family NTP-binding protein [Microbacterium sp. ISL-59]|uniref:TniB family NTP-binding protein n=1 Tax=Microbacterium sp. ISL-59 TaxID=2819159 RepID=UPI001BE98D0D|nr:TniB family NTP-binding protein [Microbacterium sp. ISL-59]MBT2496201.1 TniB family NTP-binding protein [Microbacterium sp. ISL-59]